MEKTKIQGNICVFGDSIVWGAWDKEKAGWVNRLAIYCQNKNNGFLIKFYENLLLGKNNNLHSRDLIVEELFNKEN